MIRWIFFCIDLVPPNLVELIWWILFHYIDWLFGGSCLGFVTVFILLLKTVPHVVQVSLELLTLLLLST